jgi:ribonuclease R
VRLSAIKDDYYHFDEKSYSLVGKRTGRRFRLGDKVRVKLLRADLRQRTLDFVFI